MMFTFTLSVLTGWYDTIMLPIPDKQVTTKQTIFIFHILHSVHYNSIIAITTNTYTHFY
jgi:hypothetical protein